MSNNKQTSVEQLFHKLWDTPKDKFTWYAILEEHIAIHKQEILDTWEDGQGSFPTRNEEQYYNETYGSNETIQ
jgi:hypothetical protein